MYLLLARLGLNILERNKIMRINGICTTNFGLQFTKKMNQLFDEGSKYTENRNPRSVDNWNRVKKEIEDVYDDKCIMDVKESKNNEKDIVVYPVKDPSWKFTMLTLLEDETLDRPYMILLRDRLINQKQLFYLH